MKKPILFYQYLRLFKTYQKLTTRLNNYFLNGQFRKFTKAKQSILVRRLEKLQISLAGMKQSLQLSGILVGVFASIGIASISDATAQNFIPVGPEFRVNTTTTNGQIGPSVAMDSDGDFVVAWSSYTDRTSGYDVFAQRYNAAGVAQGGEFMVNTYTTNFQNTPDIAMDGDGNFVITWNSFLQDGSDHGVYAQRFDALGVPKGSEFQVNSTSVDDQSNPDIAMDTDGDFVISWTSDNQSGGNKGDVYAQRYNALGEMQGNEFRVNTYTTYTQSSNDIAFDSNGDFIITWTSMFQDGDYAGVFAQRYNAVGIPQGNEFQINTYTKSGQGGSKIAVDKNDGFAITWTSYDQDGNYDGVFAQRYNALSQKQGSEFQINTYTTNDQSFSSIAIDQFGNFVIIWQSVNQDGDTFGVYGQAYNATGVELGAEFKVNTYTTKQQYGPIMAMDSDGDFVVTWESYFQDGDRSGIYAQRYRLNHAPTDLSLSKSSIDENVVANTEIGSFTTTDPDDTDSFTYSLVSGIGAEDNASFVIVNNVLQILISPDFETKSSYTILVRSTDEGGSTYERAFTIMVNDLSETTTSITQNARFSQGINMYPNPAKGLVHITINGTAQVRVLDLAGKIVKQENIDTQSINIADLQAGVYMVQIMQDGNTAMKKLIVE